MASITFSKVVKQYDGVKEPTVKGIDLDIKDKEFVVLVGGSGCGKSTVCSTRHRHRAPSHWPMP